jgi:ABC-type methionine transport system permease subunit
LGCSSASLSGCCGTGGIGAVGDRTGFIEPI